MSYVFDASAIIKAVELAPREAARVLRGQYTTDIAYYEVGNYIWKLFRKSLISDPAPHVELFRRLIALMKVEAVGLRAEVLGLAAGRALTYYDASYLWLAEQLNATLITEDEALCRAARRCLKTKDVLSKR